MSQCFTYRPFGSSGSQVDRQPLIESNKLQKKRKKNEKEYSMSSLFPVKKLHKKISTGLKDGPLENLLQIDIDQLESGLTDEHAQPVGKISISSESTQNSNKRKREASPPDDSSRCKGNVIRIRLPPRKQSLVEKHEPCPATSARIELQLRKQNDIVSRRELCSSSGKTLPSKRQQLLNRKQLCSTPISTLPLLPKLEKQTLVREPCSATTNPTKTELPLRKQSAIVSRQGPFSTLGRSLPLQKQTTLGRHEPCSTIPTMTESPLFKNNDLISGQEVCPTSGRTKLATSNKQGQVDVSFGQQRNNNVARFCPARPKTNKFSSASLPKSVNRLTEELVPRRPRQEMIGVCSASVSNSVTREDNAAVMIQLPEGLLPPMPKLEKICSASVTKLDNAAGFRQLPERLLPLKRDREVCSTVGESNSVDVVRNSKLLDKELVKTELQYKNLFVNWVPPSPQMVLDSDDQDWFVRKNNPDNQSTKKLKSNNNVPCSSNASLWPRAQLLPEADIYALPYTVPF